MRLGVGRGLLAAQTLFMKLINCPGAKHHGHQSFQKWETEEGEGGEKWDREGRSRSGGGVEASSGRTVEVGKVGERPRSFPDLVLVPSLCGMRPQDGGGESPFMPARHVEQMRVKSHAPSRGS